MADEFKFFGLGGCNEVGRSCHIIEYKNKVIMLDAGIHPALLGHLLFPFYDEYDLEKVDILLISHFHLDHAASLPYVMQHTRFKGKVFMTHATKAIYRWLVKDFVLVTLIGGDRQGANGGRDEALNLYSHDDIMLSLDGIETVDYHLTMEIDGIRFTAYHAGHVLGACMYFIEIGGLKILFTGDYLRTENRHLHAAEVPPQRPDVLICELTFGTGTLEPRQDLEAKLVKSIHATLARGGRVLLPVFALGNAQELLLILDEYWRQHKELQGIPIYFASLLAKKCMAVYQTYTLIMNDNIRLTATGATSNPFDFKYVKLIKDLHRFTDFGPLVMVATPGMLQAGVLRQLLERWAPDPKNLCILTGYSVEGTMAKEIIKEPATIPLLNNPDVQIARNIKVDEISFAAHVDFQENTGFIDKVQPLKIILVHGDLVPMGRLKSALLSKYALRKNSDREIKVYNPKNCEEVGIEIKGLKIARVLGQLAEEELVRVTAAVETAVGPFIKQEPEDDTPKIEEVTDVKVKQEDADVNMTDASAVKQENTDVTMTDASADAGVKQEPEDAKAKAETSETQVKTEDGAVKTEGEFDELKIPAGTVTGVLVSKDFDLNLLNLQDLHEYTNLSTLMVKLKINLRIEADTSLIQWHLEQMFGHITVAIDNDSVWEAVIMDMVVVTADKTTAPAMLVVVEWINDNLMADSLADLVVAILYLVDSSPASVKISLSLCSHSHTLPEQQLDRIVALLRSQFGDALTVNDNTADIKMGKFEATIDLHSLTVTCKSKPLKDRVETIVRQGLQMAAPLAVAPKN